MIDFLFIVFVLVVLALAGVGLMALWQGWETERARALRQARQAEQRIADIGAQAQTAIIEEALRRAQVKPTPARPYEAELYGPWDS